MENAVRTAEYLAMMAQRRAELTTQLAAMVAHRSHITGEIGCGHGHFLTGYAKHHPGEFCLGIDLIRDRIERANRKRDRAKLDNLQFVQAEAGLWLETLPTGTSFSRLYILFPDPWPKTRHHKNRLIQPEFLTAVAKRAGQGTKVYFRTDHVGYFQAAESVFQQHPSWDVSREIWPFEKATVFQARAPTYHSLVATRK